METEQKINENNVVEATENVVKTVKSQRLTIRVSRYAMSFSVPDAENVGQIEYVPYPMKSGRPLKNPCCRDNGNRRWSWSALRW